MIRINALHKGLIHIQELTMWRVYAQTLGRQQEFFNFFCVLSAKNYNKVANDSLTPSPLYQVNDVLAPSPLYQYAINVRGVLLS